MHEEMTQAAERVERIALVELAEQLHNRADAIERSDDDLSSGLLHGMHVGMIAAYRDAADKLEALLP